MSKKCSKCKEVKSWKDFSARTGRKTRSSWCKLCFSSYQRQRMKNVDISKAKKESDRKWQKAKRLSSPEWVEDQRKASRAYRKHKYANDQQWVDKQRENSRRHARENPEKYSSATARYRCNKLKCTPHWLTKFQLEEIQLMYSEARRRTQEEGIPFQVDHIVPINERQGIVCGLHVHWNLQVISKEENLIKSNNFLP